MMGRLVLVSLVWGALASLGMAQGFEPVSETKVVEGVSFATVKGKVYAPVRELGAALKVYVGWDDKARKITLDENPVDARMVRRLFDGTNMVEIRAFEAAGFEVSEVEGGGFLLEKGEVSARVSVPGQWVEINLDEQVLTAWQGARMVMETRISSGRSGYRTPTGEFTAGPEKARHRVSRTYDNSPMPYSVQVHRGYFIHGYPSVPRVPASHGCIRMPLTGANAAKWFFEWVDLGAPISIRDGWSNRVAELRSATGF